MIQLYQGFAQLVIFLHDLLEAPLETKKHHGKETFS